MQVCSDTVNTAVNTLSTLSFLRHSQTCFNRKLGKYFRQQGPNYMESLCITIIFYSTITSKGPNSKLKKCINTGGLTQFSFRFIQESQLLTIKFIVVKFSLLKFLSWHIKFTLFVPLQLWRKLKCWQETFNNELLTQCRLKWSTPWRR